MNACGFHPFRLVDSQEAPQITGTANIVRRFRRWAIARFQTRAGGADL